jgi:hypothetical protein
LSQLPASHPALQARLARVEELGIASSWGSERTEEIARLVARLPDALTARQRSDLRIIAAELMRRADEK